MHRWAAQASSILCSLSRRIVQQILTKTLNFAEHDGGVGVPAPSTDTKVAEISNFRATLRHAQPHDTAVFHSRTRFSSGSFSDLASLLGRLIDPTLESFCRVLSRLDVAHQVRRCCRLDRAKAVVMTNWHNLFKYTHLGRTITAAMTAVRARKERRD